MDPNDSVELNKGSMRALTDVAIIIGTTVGLIALRVLSGWIMQKCLLQDTLPPDPLSEIYRYVRNLCEM